MSALPSADSTARPRNPEFPRLVARMATGNEEALAELYDQTSAWVHAFAVRMVRDVAAAEEIVIDVYWKAWKEAARFDASRGSVEAWLAVFTRYRALDWKRDHARGNSKRAAWVEEPADSRPSEETEFAREECAGQVRDALGELPIEQRQVIELSFFEGLSQSEMSKSLELPLGTIKTRYRLALDKLRTHLHGIAIEEGLA